MILSAIYGLTNLINIISRLSFLFVDFSDSEFPRGALLTNIYALTCFVWLFVKQRRY